MEEAGGKQITMEDLEASKPAAPAKERKGRRQLYFHPELSTVIASAEITAKYFGVTPQTLSNWVKSGCPRFEYGYYDIKAVTEYRGRVTGQLSGPAEEIKDPEKMTPQELKVYYDQKLKAAQAEAAETRNQILSGKLLEREEVVRGLRDFAVILKRSLQGLGKKISREASSALGPTEARRFGRLMADTIDEALEQLALEGVYRYGDEAE